MSRPKRKRGPQTDEGRERALANLATPFTSLSRPISFAGGAESPLARAKRIADEAQPEAVETLVWAMRHSRRRGDATAATRASATLVQVQRELSQRPADADAVDVSPRRAELLELVTKALGTGPGGVTTTAPGPVPQRAEGVAPNRCDPTSESVVTESESESASTASVTLIEPDDAAWVGDPLPPIPRDSDQ